MNYLERYKLAVGNYLEGMKRVQNCPMPNGQKYSNGTCVKISENLGASMLHFPSGKKAIVLYTYAHAYGGDDIKSYCLNIDDVGKVSWYNESQLSKC